MKVLEIFTHGNKTMCICDMKGYNAQAEHVTQLFLHRDGVSMPVHDFQFSPFKACFSTPQTIGIVFDGMPEIRVGDAFEYQS